MPLNYGNEEEQSRKLFVGGISLDTTDDGMNAYFAKYGKITDCVVIRDKNSQRSKGFGFVTYETEEEADKCMIDRPHSLDGRTIDCKRAVSREESSKPGAHVQVKKVFVGGVKTGLDERKLREFFETFGNIISVDIPLDREHNPKGFAFVTFDDFDVADKLVAKRHFNVAGFDCEVKKALSKDEMEKSRQQLEMKSQRGFSSPRGGRGGRGGRGRGGRGGGDGFGGGPMRGQYGQSQRSGGPYGGGYGSGGSYGSGYSSGGNYGSGYGGAGGYEGNYGSSYGGGYDTSYPGNYEGYGANNNNGYGSYNNYQDQGKYY